MTGLMAFLKKKKRNSEHEYRKAAKEENAATMHFWLGYMQCLEDIEDKCFNPKAEKAEAK